MADDDSTLPLPRDLGRFTSDLINDLAKLRAGEITVGDARARAQLAREVIRSVQVQLQGYKVFADAAKRIGGGTVEAE